MRRAVALGTVTVVVGALGTFAIRAPHRDATTFPVAPGTERTFPANLLVPGDRFTCHGALVPLHGRGAGAISSDGLDTMTALDGTVTITCPEHLAPL